MSAIGQLMNTATSSEPEALRARRAERRFLHRPPGHLLEGRAHPLPRLLRLESLALPRRQFRRRAADLALSGTALAVAAFSRGIPARPTRAREVAGPWRQLARPASPLSPAATAPRRRRRW